MKVHFTHDGEWWFDPETGEYEYDGPSGLIRVALRSMDSYETIQPHNLYGLDEHPGETWRDLSPEERKAKILKYITQIDGVEVNESRKAESH